VFSKFKFLKKLAFFGCVLSLTSIGNFAQGMKGNTIYKTSDNKISDADDDKMNEEESRAQKEKNFKKLMDLIFDETKNVEYRLGKAFNDFNEVYLVSSSEEQKKFISDIVKKLGINSSIINGKEWEEKAEIWDIAYHRQRINHEYDSGYKLICDHRVVDNKNYKPLGYQIKMIFETFNNFEYNECSDNVDDSDRTEKQKMLVNSNLKKNGEFDIFLYSEDRKTFLVIALESCCDDINDDSNDLCVHQ